MLAEWAMLHYRVKTELSETDGKTVTSHFYPYSRNGATVAYKHRKLPKTLTCVGDFKNLELFGAAQARASGSRKLYITEGELDTISLYQVLRENSRGTQWANIEPAVVSICNGAQSAVRDLSRNIEFIKGFHEVILVFDQDEAGQKATEDVLKLIPEALVARFDGKDPNDMLMSGRASQLAKACLFGARRHKPASVVTVEDVFDRAIAKPAMGLSWPWPSLTKATYGINRKRLYGLGAGVGLGKSDWAKQVQAHLVKEHKVPIGLFNFEEDVGRSLKGIAGKIHNKLYHLPDKEFPEEELRTVIGQLKEKVFLFDHFGTRDWAEVKAAIRYMVVAEGIKDIFLDPLTALVSHLSASEANDALNNILSDIAGLTHELEFTVYYFSHLNVPQHGPNHERGGKVNEAQFTGSRACMRWSQYVFGLEGNKDPELNDIDRNTRYLEILKDRDFGNSARIPLFYNRDSGSLLEPEIGMY